MGFPSVVYARPIVTKKEKVCDVQKPVRLRARPCRICRRSGDAGCVSAATRPPAAAATASTRTVAATGGTANLMIYGVNTHGAYWHAIVSGVIGDYGPAVSIYPGGRSPWPGRGPSRPGASGTLRRRLTSQVPGGRRSRDIPSPMTALDVLRSAQHAGQGPPILNTLPWQSSQLCAADASPRSILPTRHIGGYLRIAADQRWLQTVIRSRPGTARNADSVRLSHAPLGQLAARRFIHSGRSATDPAMRSIKRGTGSTPR